MNDMSPALKVVGEITPPDYKDPVQMLRNLADEIENGDHGGVDTIAIATFGSAGLEIFGGGKDSDMHHCTYVFGAANLRLLNISLGGE